MDLGQFLSDLFKMMVELEPLTLETEARTLVFAAGCYVVGVLMVVLDLCLVSIGLSSVMGFSHGLKTTPVLLLAWPLGAAITGYFGYVLQIFQLSALACITAGIAWQVAIIKIVKKLTGGIEEETDVIEETD